MPLIKFPVKFFKLACTVDHHEVIGLALEAVQLGQDHCLRKDLRDKELAYRGPGRLLQERAGCVDGGTGKDRVRDVSHEVKVVLKSHPDEKQT